MGRKSSGHSSAPAGVGAVPVVSGNGVTGTDDEDIRRGICPAGPRLAWVRESDFGDGPQGLDLCMKVGPDTGRAEYSTILGLR